MTHAPSLPKPGRAQSGEHAVVISEDVLDGVVEQLNQLGNPDQLDRKLALGKLVFEQIYAGQQILVEGRGQNHSSFRRLARRADLKVSATTIFRATKLFLVAQHLDAPRLERLRVGHFYAVSSLPLPDQVALLHAAAEQGTQVADLRRAVARRRQRPVNAEVRRPGRLPLNPIVFRLRHLERSVAACLESLGDLPNYDSLAARERQEVERTLLKTCAWVNRQLQALEASTQASADELDAQDTVHDPKRRALP